MARNTAYGPGEFDQARRNAYAQGPDVGRDFDETHPSTNYKPGEFYKSNYDYDNEGNVINDFDWLSSPVEWLDNPEGGGGNGGGGGNPDWVNDNFKQAQAAQRAFMAQQGIQGKQDAASMKATQNLLNNPGMQFGKGGGDWASAWSRAMQPQRGIFESLVGNQLGSFLDYGKGLNQIFNSPTGPYGQMQAAAVATAPSRAQRAISKDKLGMLSGLFDQMSANKTPSVSSVETDYGAYAKMLPSLMKKYLPGG